MGGLGSGGLCLSAPLSRDGVRGLNELSVAGGVTVLMASWGFGVELGCGRG
jgi:hypothetical protein